MGSTTLEIAYWINRTADAWWRSFGYAAVQVAIVGVAVFVLVTLGRRWSASLRYGILLVLLAKFVIAPISLLWDPGFVADVATVEVPVRSEAVKRSFAGPDELATSAVVSEPVARPQTPASSAVSESILPEPASMRDDPKLWSSVAFPGWAFLLHLLGSVTVVLWLLYQSVRLALWVVRRSVPVSPEIESLCFDVQRELGYYKRLSVRVGAEAGSPMAFQLFRPVIVLPEATIESLSPEELRPVLAHEVAHLKRRDSLVNTLQILLFGVWWFHPVYWWLSRKLRAVREECCDDAVLSLTAQRQDSYCQTLLDAARSCKIAVAGRVVLGFGESRSSMGRRITRIMDSRVSKRVRLGGVAAVVLVLVTVASVPMWAVSSSLDNPTPATDVHFSSGPLESLMAQAGLRRPAAMPIGAAEFAALEDCIEQSRLTRSSSNGVTYFERESTRDALLVLRGQMAEPFYAEFLLSKWYETKGDPDEAARWMDKALADAPVVLVRRYEFMDGRPLANAPVGTLGIEYRMSTPSQQNTYLVLEYVNLTTDKKGQVYLPGYDTKIRCNSTEWPKGYEIETGRHGYLALHGRYNLLPTIYVWPEGSSRPATTLPTSEFYDYRDAVPVQGLSARVGVAELAIDRCYRIGGDGRVAVTDGRKSLDPTSTAAPTFALQSPALDQAAIKFKRSTLKSYEILQVRVFDHANRTLLLKYHAPADYEYDGDSTISLRSLGAELPERVDVWFWVTEFPPDQSVQVVPVQVGSQVDAGGYTATLRALHSGARGWSTTHGPDGRYSVSFSEPNDPNAKEMEVAFQIEAREDMRTDKYARVAVVTKDGKRYFDDHVIYASDGLNVYDFSAPLSEVDHFELLPIGKEQCFYFDGVLLPQRSGPPLDANGAVELEVAMSGRSGVFPPDGSGPIHGTVTVLPGRSGMTMESGQGLEDARYSSQWYPNGPYRDKDTYTTIVCEFSGLSDRFLEVELLDGAGHPIQKRGGGRSAGLYYQQQPIPADQIEGLKVRFSRAVTP